MSSDDTPTDSSPADAMIVEPTPLDRREYTTDPRGQHVRATFQVERDRAYLARAYLSGMSLGQIAAKLHLDPSTVARDLQAIKEQWRESQLVDFTYKVQEELAKIDALEQTYWIAWRDSQKDHVTTTKEDNEVGGKFGHDILTREKKRTSKPNTGAPWTLLGVQWCIEERIKLLGLAAPTKIAPTTPDGREPYDPHAAESKLTAIVARYLSENAAKSEPERPRIVDGVATER